MGIKKDDENGKRSQKLNKNIPISSSQNESSCYDIRDDDSGDDLKVLIEKLPHIKRTDTEARLIQTFLSPEEKAEFELKCEGLGLKMSHVLRCLAVQFAKTNGGCDQ